MTSATLVTPQVTPNCATAEATPETGGASSPVHAASERIAGYPVHEAASAFPLMDGPEFDDFVASIAANGQRDPVDILNGALIEGRNRARAVELLKSRGHVIELRTVEWTPRPGQTVAEYVADKNMRRRHLTAAQRAQIAADLVPMIERERAAAQMATRIQPRQVLNPTGINQHSTQGKADAKTNPPSETKADNRAKVARSTVGKIAAVADVTPYAAARAVKIKKNSSPEVVAAVKAGTKKPKEAVAEIATAAGSGPSAKPGAKKPIDHPFVPRTPLQEDLLAGWVRMRDSKVAINERVTARDDMRQILKAEDEAEKLSEKSGRHRSTVTKKTASEKARAK